jgi:hypothetical protein
VDLRPRSVALQLSNLGGGGRKKLGCDFKLMPFNAAGLLQLRSEIL